MNEFWTAQPPSSSGGALTLEMMQQAFEKCSRAADVPARNYILMSHSQHKAVGQLGQQTIQEMFDQMAITSGSHTIFGNLTVTAPGWEACAEWIIGSGKWPFDHGELIP